MKYFLRLPLLKMFCPWKEFERHSTGHSIGFSQLLKSKHLLHLLKPSISYFKDDHCLQDKLGCSGWPLTLYYLFKLAVIIGSTWLESWL